MRRTLLDPVPAVIVLESRRRSVLRLGARVNEAGLDPVVEQASIFGSQS